MLFRIGYLKLNNGMIFGKDLMMKTLCLIAVLMGAVCLVGCEDPELVTCQQEKATLQSELEQANAAISEKDAQIKKMKTENTEMQTQAMESIQTMMTKQAEKDNQIKAKIVEKTKQIKDLEAKVAMLETEVSNQKSLHENMKKALHAVELEKQDLIEKLNDAQEQEVETP